MSVNRYAATSFDCLINRFKNGDGVQRFFWCVERIALLGKGLVQRTPHANVRIFLLEFNASCWLTALFHNKPVSLHGDETVRTVDVKVIALWWKIA